MMMTSNLCTLYIVRHGETEWNVEGRIQGQLDSPLTEKGMAVSRELAEKLKDVQLDAIFSSDLSRAAQTAEIIKLNRELSIATEKALRERTFGKYDGFLGDEYDREVQELLSEYEQLSEEGKWQFKFDENYESDEELVSRFITFLREVAVGYAGKTVLVVSHGGNLRTFLTKLGFASYGELRPGTFKNAGYVIVESDGVDFFLKEVEGVDMSQGIASKTL